MKQGVRPMQDKNGFLSFSGSANGQPLAALVTIQPRAARSELAP